MPRTSQLPNLPKPSPSDPLWYKDALIYELNVRAFADSTGNGIGDFAGLIDKLDYLQDLGVTALWLLPFYPSPLRDDGYDISSYRDVHPDFGQLRDFRRFVREAHRRDLKVITELVVNHTSDQHPWFQAARRAKPGSARRDFYVWSDTDTRFPETRIIFTDTESSNWTWDPVAGSYYWHRFFHHQPDLNHNNPRVVEAIVRLMRFWFDMGVDGMRLDAVPYLCVRDGTNNENLPETHAVIKEYRRRLDERYPDRMFLAEANQWPDDVRPYFGDGDECHMAFHFPLMPRIFMAIRREDRFPIVDILKRTPEIPDSCQWAVFLRNHDELTLEMVTDEERDYMYREYAMDSRMRLNVGIRRRLAPLVDNSRRRVELLNSLLLSFPGTPVIYYGDEIGMGDNIYLGDRNGVRTPMQWSADRNAGFSRADPAQLYLPVIMDPVYGYQSVNVEAQQRSPSSLLHFMKRLIALRRQHRAFGRGAMEILEPSNRSVLAYLRRYRGEVILAVANLSRFAQPVELGLGEFNGATPVELFGGTEFPQIGELPYLLTLGPHSFLWFRLDPEPRPVPLRRPGGEETDVVPPEVGVEGGPDRLLDVENRYRLEHDVLRWFVPRQRWFRGKARDLADLTVCDQVKLGAGFHVLFVTVMYADGDTETYSLPVKVARGARAETVLEEVPESVLCRSPDESGAGALFDALADATACRNLYTSIADCRRFATVANGRLSAYPTRAMSEHVGLDSEPKDVHRLGVEQSNTSVVIGEASIIKWFRTVEHGVNPDMEVGRFLTERTGFTGIAPVLGGIDYQAPDDAVSTLAMLQTFVPNEGDGWSYMVRQMVSCLNSSAPAQRGAPEAGVVTAVLEHLEEQLPPAVEESIGELLGAADRLGVRTAELHRAVSAESRDRSFVPEPLTPTDLDLLAESFLARAQSALGLLDSRLGTVPEALRSLCEEVLAGRPTLLAHLQQLRDLEEGTGQRIRCHGDYHLGQVLRVEDDFLLLDFEGEPLVQVEQRREKHSPLKDVAGMLRSFSYAASVAAASADAASADGGAGLENVRQRARRCELWTAIRFVQGYVATARDAEFLPSGTAFAVLLTAFMLDKALYELRYELLSRPDWVHLPLGGVAEFLHADLTPELNGGSP